VPTAFGTDRLESGADGRAVLVCSTSKGWRPRASGVAARRAEHPGTAVKWDGEIFEVVSAEPVAGGGIRYEIAPWRQEVAIRSLERYDAESEGARADERHWREQAVRRRRLSILLAPLLGHLPGPVQEAMEHEFGAPANAMTASSALPLLVLGIIGLLGHFVQMLGGSLAPLPQPPLPLSLYLFGESALRLALVATQSRPAGSIPGAVLYEIWKRTRP
jgi:hypothetical protein